MSINTQSTKNGFDINRYIPDHLNIIHQMQHSIYENRTLKKRLDQSTKRLTRDTQILREYYGA